MLLNIFLVLLAIGAITYFGFIAMMIFASRPKFNNATVINKSLSNQYYYKPDSIVHAMNGNFFSLGATALENADRETFEVLAFNFAKDKNQVYYNELIVEDADPETFQLIYSDNQNQSTPYIYYSKDKNFVYYTCNKIEGADPESFEYLGGDYTKDNNALYYWDKKICLLADGNTKHQPMPVKNDNTGSYCIVGNKVFYMYKEIKEVDSSSFEAVNEQFSKDAHSVYYLENKFDEADPDTFEVLNDAYQRDYKYLYYNTVAIPGASPSSYQFLSILFSKDAHQVYYCGRILEEVDATNFTLKDGEKLDEYRKHVNLTLDDHHCIFVLRKECHEVKEFEDDEHSSRYHFYKDDVFFGFTKIIGMKKNDFRIIPNGEQCYCTNDKNVYYCSNIIPKADPETFQAINDSFSKDQNNVYFMTLVIKDQDPKQFVYKDQMWGEEVEDGIAELRVN